MDHLPISHRVAAVQTWLITNSLDALVVPSADPHQSEYPPARFQSRVWLSGFDGSAGTVVVTRDRAGLWTDSRYYLHAEQVLEGTGIELFRLGVAGVTDYPGWLAGTLDAHARVGVDSRLITRDAADRLRETLEQARISLVDAGDPMDELWTDRPGLPAEAVVVYPSEWAGETRATRLARVRERISAQGATSHVISTLDDIAWLLLLRGSDVAYNPVFVAHLIVTATNATLYTDTTRVDAAALAELTADHVTVRAYERFETDLAALEAPVAVDPSRSSWWISNRLGPRMAPVSQPSADIKSRKNDVQLGHLRRTMVRDGQAMVRFLRALEESVAAGESLDEYGLVQRLHAERASAPTFRGDAFDTISGFGPNGAVVHYRVQRASALPVTAPGVYLVDSGAQYLDGTTDITRTVAIGGVGGGGRAGGGDGSSADGGIPEEARADFTYVLKAHIALATLVFPVGVSGHEIDAIARAALWRAHRSYGHGTGHGVGFYLNVHEGPQRIALGSPAWPLAPGMIISNEPGLYRTGRWGIRIENLVAVQRDGESEFGSYLSFETLSLCPIDRRMIVPELLSRDELAWIDAYHARVFAELSQEEATPTSGNKVREAGGLTDRDRDWLDRACAPLTAAK